MKRITLLVSFCLFSLRLLAQSPVIYFKFDETNGTNTAHDEISNTNLPISNQFNKPERVIGVTGNALRTDGFSTWIQTNKNLGLTNSLTLETWLVLESYPSDVEVPYASLTPSAIVSQTDGNNGFALFINTFGVWYLTVNVNGTKYTCQAPAAMPLYSWNHVVAVVDGTNGAIKLYLNGAQVATTTIPVNGTINVSTNPLIIGKSNIDLTSGIFLVNALDGTYDETKIYNSVLSPNTISSDYSTGSSTITTTGDQAIAVSPTRFTNDLQRPAFHALPPANWTNEPHGMASYNGTYHLFYQRTPNGPFKYEMHWGHMTSTDFVHWTNVRDAIWPQLEWSATSGYDMKGCWSGDVVVNAGVAHAFYTSVNQSGPYNPGIGHASSTDANLSTWTKTTPVIDKQYVNDFRDPYIFKDGTTWVMIIGAALSGSGGLDCYTSPDLVTWTHKSNFCTVPYSSMDIGSVIWEMPVFEPLANGKYILEANPIGGNIAKYGPQYTRGVYWIGTYSGGQFTPDYNQPKMLDVIHGHLSPTVTRNANNQLTGIGIVDERRSSQAQLNAGWAHLYSLPRVWSLLGDNETLGQAPAPQLSTLRLGSPQTLTNVSVSSTTPVNVSSGNAFEMIAVADPTTTATNYGLNLRISNDRSEITRLYYDAVNKKLVLDKSKTTLSPDDEEKVLISENYDETAFGKPSTFHIFMDNSVMDVFINEKAAFSARIYPTKADSKGVELYSQGGTTNFTSVSTWSLGFTNVPVTGVSLNKTKTTIYAGKTDTLVASVVPANATNSGINWTSSNTAIATVDAHGVVSGVAQGTATITATTADGGFTATCMATIDPPITYATYDFESGNLNGWTVTSGTEFVTGNVCSDTNWGWGGPFNQQGTYHFWGFKTTGDGAVGSMQTQPFTIGGDGIISFLIGGGNDINNLYLALCRSSDNTVLLKATGTNNEAYTAQTMNAASYIGTSCYIKVVDNSTAGFGHINLDNIKIPIPGTTVHVTGVTLNKTHSSINISKTDTLKATVSPANATSTGVSWASNNTAVATVDAAGVVTGVAAGTAVIKVTTQDLAFTATDTVTVTAVHVTGVTLNKTTSSINVGKTDTLKATVSPANATNTTVTWSSNNSSVATVSTTGVVTAVAAGTAVITVTTQDLSFTATCTVTVTATSTGYLTYDFESGNLNGWTVTSGSEFVTGNVCTDTNWEWGGPFNQQGTYHFWGFKTTGDGAVGSMQTQPFTLGGDGNISFMIGGGNDINNLYLALCRTSDNAILMKATGANNEAYSTQTFNAANYIGTNCYIKVVDNSTGGFGHINLDDLKIPVNTSVVHVTGVTLNKTSSSIIVGKADTLVATVSPSNATNSAVTWTSSNNAVATVSTTGIISAVAAGTDTITVTTQDLSFTAKCVVTVITQPYLVLDFETGDLTNWTVVSGNEFVPGNVCSDVNWSWGGPFGQQGTYHFWGFKATGDGAVGVMKTANFTLSGDGQISFMIAGGNDINNIYLALCRASDNTVLLKVTGTNNEAYSTQTFNGTPYIGTTCYIEAVDNSTGGFGHINLDNIKIPVTVNSPHNRNLSAALLNFSNQNYTAPILKSPAKIYPVPVIDRFTVDLHSMDEDNAVLQITDLMGKVVYTQHVNAETSYYLSAKDLRMNQSIYFVTVKGKHSYMPFKILVRN
ncbi:MAG: Ig-like domain-containing protein [Mucilaginibacter sp.]